MADHGIVQADFFISRAGEDKDVAVLVDKVLRDAGHKTFVQDNDFGPASFMARMAQGWSSGARLICLLSKAYQQSEHCKAEYEVALKDDPRNLKECVIVLRIEDCDPIEHLAVLAYTDLVPLLTDAEGFARVVRGASRRRDRKEADFAALYRRAPKLIVHPDIRPVPSFTGREAELAAVDAALWEKGGTVALTNVAASAAVKGLGGVGKSVLAQEYAWRNRARYQGVWWIRAEKSETLLDDLIELGARFIPGIREVPDRAQAAHAALDHVAQMRADKPWLLVYDNVEQPGDIARLTPAEGAHVLITTRWPVWHGHAEELPVDVFSPPLAVAFLLAHARKPDADAAARLAADLGYLPLALAHARALCWSEGWDFDRYRAKLPELIRKAPRGAAYPAPVFATFDLALQKAAARCAAAEALMGICAFLAPDRIPLDIVTADVMSEIDRGEAVAALQEVSLATLEPLDDGSACISLHRLVQQVMRGRLTDRAEAEKTFRSAKGLIVGPWPKGNRGGDPRHWSTCRRLLPHALAIFDHPDGPDGTENPALLLSLVAHFYEASADYGSAEVLMRRAVAIDEKSFGGEHPNVAIRLNNLASPLKATSRYDEAEALMRRALAIDEKNFGPGHPTVAIRLNNLAQLYQDTNRLGEAEQLMRRALAINETRFGSDHPRVAIDLTNLAALLQATDRLNEAEPLIRRALAINEASFGPEHRRVAIGLNVLAQLLKAMSRPAEAEPLYRRALTIDETNYGPDHPKVALRLNNLASLLRATNRLRDAEPLVRRALAIFEDNLGVGHVSTQIVRRNLIALTSALRGDR